MWCLVICCMVFFAAYWSFVMASSAVLVWCNLLCVGCAITIGLIGRSAKQPHNILRNGSTFNTVNTIWIFIAIVLAWFGVQLRLVQGPFASEVLLVAFGAWLSLVLTQWVLRLGYELKLPTKVYWTAFIGLVLTSGFASIHEKDTVNWRYRNHPEFIQAYEWHTLDPENYELRQQMMQEHYRIVLTEEEFRKYQESNRTERRHKNQW